MALTHALNGLHGIHAKGGFHRDIKPDDLLVGIDAQTGQKVIKLGDFGLARVPSHSSGPITHTKHGTFGYIAPEILRGSPFMPSADVFSLGVVGLELLTGGRNPPDLAIAKAPSRLRTLLEECSTPTPIDVPRR
jgi:serine/threonine protein kinase